MGGGEGALPADRDEGVDAVVVEGAFDSPQSLEQHVGIGAGGAEHGAALGQQPVGAVVVVDVDLAILQ